MLLKRFMSLLLVFVLLLSDSGIKLFAHTCLKSKHTHFSIVSEKHCCGETSKAESCAIKKSGCCDVKSTYIKCNFVFEKNEGRTALSEVSVLYGACLLGLSSTQSIDCIAPPSYSAPPHLFSYSFPFTSVIRC
jgi:hypothetical protein